MIDTRIISVPKNNNKGGGNTTNNIVTNQVVIDSQSIQADSGVFDSIESNEANIENLTSNNITATTVSADTISASTNIVSENIQTNDIEVEDLITCGEINSNLIDTNHLYADDANFTNTNSTNLTSTTASITNISGTTLNYQNATIQQDLDVGNDIYVNGSVFGNYGEFDSINSTEIYTSNVDVDGKATFTKTVGGVYKTTVEGDKIKLSKQGTNTNTTIEYNQIDTPNLQAVNGVFEDSLETDNFSATTATIQDLLVTGTAHFYELMIDKIKSSEGQIILTAANAKVIYVQNQSTDYKCYFQATDSDGNAITNNFYIGDLVVCQNFNVNQGLSTNVHNKFYWAKVTDIEDADTETITIDGNEIQCWWIKLSFASGNYASNSNAFPEVGDEIVLLGSTVSNRQSAIIMSAYANSYLDPSIQPPSIVQYSGINDFNLSNHRYNVIAKNGNIFKGEFKTTTNADIEDLIQNNSFVIKALYPTYSALVQAHPTGIQGEAYAVGTSASNVVYIWDVDSSSWKDIGSLQGPQGPQGAKGDTGDKGDKGDKGDQGIQGIQGEKGDQGIQGIQGIQGAKGDKGDKGDTGAKGDKGDKGDAGNNGVSISSVTEYYLISNASSNVTTATTGWQTTFIAPTSQKKYLWNYEQINYSNGTNTKTIPVIIGNYAADGNNGRGISSIVEYYLAHYNNTGITHSTAGWSTTVPTMTNISKYLWNYEQVNFTDGMGYNTDPKIIGVYGDSGENAEEWIINPDREEAYIDTDGNLDVRLGYELYHVVGNERTLQNISSDGYHFIVYADKADSQHSYFLMTSNSISKNNFITDYYNVSSANRPTYFNVYLCYGTGDDIVNGVPCRNIIITYTPMASLEVKTTVNEQGQTIGQINATVAGHTSSINSLTNDVSQLQIQASGISATVQSNTTSISDLDGEFNQLKDDTFAITSDLSGRISTTNRNVANLQIQADNISSTVSSVSNKVDNMKVGSTQLLRGINKMGSLTNTAANATWEKGAWLLTSGGNGTGTQFTLTDSPNKLCQIGWRISNNTSGNRDFAQFRFPWIKGQEYTFSGYARAINGSGASLLIRCWDNTAGVARMTYTKTLSSGSWQYFSYTFTLSTETDITNSQFAFGLQGNCSAEFCCIKLEKGNIATDFSENPNDIETELNTLTTNVSEVKQTASSLTTSITTLQNQVNAIPIEKTVTVDATSLSTSTYYPVSIMFNFNYGKCPSYYIRCKVQRTLINDYGVPSYSNHQNGFVVDLDWNCKAGGWGTNNISIDWSTNDNTRIINDYSVNFVKTGEDIIVGSIRQNWMKSTEIVYVRGGSKYDVSTSWPDSTIQLNPNGYSWSSGSYSYSSPTKSASQIVVPIKDAMSKTQIEQTAKGITSTVTSQILQGDTNNLFYPACYNSDGMLNDKNQFFATSYSGSTNKCSDWYCDNLTKYGKPIKDSKTYIEINANSGEVYLYTPWVSLSNSKTYTLTFGGFINNTCYLELCRYSSLANAISANQTIASTTSITTFSSNSNYTYNSNVISFTPSTTSSYYRLRFRLTTSTVATPVLNLNNLSLYEGNISAGGFADWNFNVSKATSVISQEADKISLGVEKAGINLTTGKITSIADNFEWKNNNNETILGINSDGDAEFAGTVKAKNFYHGICLAEWIQNNTSYPNWNVKYNVNGALYIADKTSFAEDYNVHDLVPSSELNKISTGDLVDLTDTVNFPTIISLYNQNYQMDGAIPCIGYADEAIFMTPTSSSGDKYVILPRADKCVGKIVTVYNKSYSTATIQVKSAYSLDRLSPVAFYYNGSALVSGNSGQSISINHNQWIKFLALSNGWLAMANGTSTFT